MRERRGEERRGEEKERVNHCVLVTY